MAPNQLRFVTTLAGKSNIGIAQGGKAVTDRGSTKHSPRVDEVMRRETESLVRGSPVEARADESRMMEPGGEGEPRPDARLSVDDIELRSMLAVSVRPGAFPADRARLLTVAREENAEEWVVTWLETLPESVEFPTVEAVWEALGGRRERRDAPLTEPERTAGPPARATTARSSVTTNERTPAPESSAEQPSGSSIEPEPGPGRSPIDLVVRLASVGVRFTVGAAAEVVRIARRLL